MNVREPQPALSKPTAVRIRRAQRADAGAIAEIHVGSWQSAYRGILPDNVLDQLSVEQRAQKWSEILAGGESTTIVAEDRGAIVGFANFAASRDADADATRVAEILAVYVSPSCWGRGVGTRLCEAALGELAAGGFAEVTLWVLQRNEQAIGFYDGLGFTTDGATQERIIGTAQEVIRLRRSLEVIA